MGVVGGGFFGEVEGGVGVGGAVLGGGGDDLDFAEDFALLDDMDVKFFKPGDISQVVAEFKEKRPAIEALVDGLANEDKSGAQSIKEQISSFYRGLDRRFH